MKVEKIITKTETNELEITGATLLSKDEAKELPMRLREYNCRWWLRSSVEDYDYYDGGIICACDVDIVCSDGSVNYNDYAHDSGCRIRPALQIKNLESSNLQIGDKFIFAEKQFEIVSNEIAFCLDDIGTHCFRENWQAPDANVYKKSDVKKFVDKWFEEARK